VAGFWAFAGTIHADWPTPTADTFTLSTDGKLVPGVRWGGYNPGESYHIYWYYRMYYGDYPDTSHLTGAYGQHGCSWGEITRPMCPPPCTDNCWWGSNNYFDFEHWIAQAGTGYETTLGHYWIEEYAWPYTSPDAYYYTNLNRTAVGVWSIGEPPPTYPLITISSPANNSIVTNAADTISISWANIDHTTYPDFYVDFEDLSTYEGSINVINTLSADSGTLVIPFADFAISHKGSWQLSAWAASADGLTILPLTYTPYSLDFELSTLPPPFSLQTFPDWYAANISDTTSPAAWTIYMDNFTQPIFLKIGQFGQWITNYMNITDAYTKGFTWGGYLPITQAYVDKINLFFGGFPLMTIFEWCIGIMVAIFALKAILKLLGLIPFIAVGG
jgi:hypothetical protein